MAGEKHLFENNKDRRQINNIKIKASLIRFTNLFVLCKSAGGFASRENG